MEVRVLKMEFVWLSALCILTCTQTDRVYAHRGVCYPKSSKDAILGFKESKCVIDRLEKVDPFMGVTEGDEVSLHRVLNMVHSNGYEFAAVLFYASWCPFSKICRPSFSIMSSMYPSIPHFAIEESSIRPSILSKYGVHGFPTLFLLNSTMRIRYHGSRTSASLLTFYGDVTGTKTVSLDRTSLENIGRPSNHDQYGNGDVENCPFSWARSPWNLLRHETYLALATTFVLSRLLYHIFPALLLFSRGAWRRHMRNVSLWDRPLVYVNQSMLIFKSLMELCKRRVINARAWAYKSLASVSVGESSPSFSP